MPGREPAWRRLARYISRHRRPGTAVAVIVSAVAIGGHFLGGLAGLWEFYLLAGKPHVPAETQIRPSSSTPSFSITQRPFRSLAVLPIVAKGSAPKDVELANNLTQLLTTITARAFPDGLVVSHGLAQKYATASDPRVVGRDLNVRYLIEGNLTHKGETDILGIELIDSLDGSRVWADQQVISTNDADSTLGKFGNALRIAVTDATRKEIASLPENEQTTWKLVLRAGDIGNSIKGLQEQQALYEEALSHDPNFVQALLNLSWTMWMRLENEPNKRDDLLPRMDEITLRATRAAPNDPRTWTYRGVAMRYQGNWKGAFAANDEALRIDPFRSHTLTQRGALLIYAGRPSEALPVLARALELDPSDQADATVYRCLAYLDLGRDGEAVGPCETSAARTSMWTRYLLLAAAYGNLGNKERAEYWRRKLVDANPQFSIQRLRNMRVTDDPHALEQMEHWISGLRKAGIPEK